MRGLDLFITGNDGLDYFMGYCEDPTCRERDEVFLEECNCCHKLRKSVV